MAPNVLWVGEGEAVKLSQRKRMAAEILDPTGFPLEKNDPLASSHRLINAYLRRIPEGAFAYGPVGVLDGERIEVWYEEAATEILQLPVADQFGCIRACTRFSYWSRFEWGWASNKPETQIQRAYEFALSGLCTLILNREREWSEAEIKEMVGLDMPYPFPKAGCVSPVVEAYLARYPVTETLRASIEEVREWNARLHCLSHWMILGDALGEPLVLHRDEKWADEAIALISAQPEEVKELWREFLLHCIRSEKTKPSAKWLTTSAQYLERIGLEAFDKQFVVWCKHYGQSLPSYELNQAVFKGLVWSASLVPSQQIAKSIANIALSCTTANDMTISFFSLSLFNACIWSLDRKSVV